MMGMIMCDSVKMKLMIKIRAALTPSCFMLGKRTVTSWMYWVSFTLEKEGGREREREGGRCGGDLIDNNINLPLFHLQTTDFNQPRYSHNHSDGGSKVSTAAWCHWNYAQSMCNSFQFV